MKFSTVTGIAAVAGALTATCLTSSAGASVVYSTGFEAPAFLTGTIHGQSGWGMGGDPSLGLIENTLVKDGAQAVEVFPSQSNDQVGPYYDLQSGAKIVQQSADIYIASSSSETEWQFAATGPQGLGFVTGVNIDLNGDLYAITSHFPYIGTLTKDVWNNISLTMNFATQTASIAVNGSTIASNLAFCGDNFGGCAGARVSTYGEGFIDTFSNSFGPTYTPNDYAAMDNYIVSGVPEPSSVALIPVALAGLLLARRNRLS